jgi:phosphoribosyl-ATP pyrophosphohydrolase/phosphoribosyl-AMP cyclohydrolase
VNSAFDSEHLDWNKNGGLLPAVVQHAHDGRVLMLGYMNRAALQVTLESGKVTFYSRSKQRLRTKGESSGHVLELQSLHADCDNDSLLALALPRGPTCHLGRDSCFGDGAAPVLAFVGQLDALIALREQQRPQGSYTTRLFEAGVHRIAQKLGEEGVETALAAVAQNDDALRGEAADLLYHLLVLLRARGLGLDAVAATLALRHAGH